MTIGIQRGRAAALGAAIALMATWASPAPAATAQDDRADSQSQALEEIVVTATRRDELLSRVPVSVTAFSQEAMDQLGVKDFQDVARFTPGVAIDDTGTNAISIRGISSSAGAGTTGIYIDDTPMQMRSVGFNPDDALPRIFDLDRVEVLRGPQGTLFGAGSEGGTVRYLLAQPKLTGSSTYLRSEVSQSRGGAPSYELGIAHGGTLIDNVLGWRGSVWYRNEGGWIDRVDPYTGAVLESNADYSHTTIARLAALWRPAERLSITPSVIYQDTRTHTESTYWPAFSGASSGQFANATPELQPVPDKFYLPAVRIELQLPHSQLISNSSYFHRDEQTAYQGTVYDLAYYQSLAWPDNPNTGGLACADTGLPAPPPCSWYPLIDATGIHLPAGLSGYQSPSIVTNRQQGWTEELRLQSTDKDARLRWTVGAFWEQSKQFSLEEVRDTQINQLLSTLFAVNGAADVFGDYYTCNGQGIYTVIPECDTYYNANTTTDRQTALFGELDYALTDRLRLTLGDRVARTSFSLVHYADGIQNFGPGDPPVTVASQTETANTPKVGLSFQRDAQNLFYATIAKGFRPGGGNAPLPSYCDVDLAAAGFPGGAPLTYSSDSTQSFELGSKHSLGRRLRLATSLYYIRWQDIQQNVYVGGGCGLQFTGNLGTAVAQGFDLQLELAVRNLKLDLAAGYTDARYTRDTPVANSCGINGDEPCLPLARSGDAISGQASIENSPGAAPPWTLAIGAQYDFRLGAMPAFVRMDYQLRTRNNWPSALQDAGTAQFNAGTYTLPANAYASLRAGVTREPWNVALFVDNLFDSRTVLNYQLGQIDPYNPDPPSVQQNQYTFRPRTVGLTLSYHR